MGINTLNDLSLCAYPDVLTTASSLISSVDDTLSQQIEAMAEFVTKYNLPGVTGPHFNLSSAVIVLNDRYFPGAPKVLVNPKIETCKGLQSAKMECFYFPGVAAIIKRPQELTLTYLDTNGKEQSLHATELLAAWLSYCDDCLNGKLVLAHMSGTKKKLFLSKYKKQLHSGGQCGTNCGHDHH